MPRAKKGSQFERAICKQLSLWWSGNESDDLFWRTAGSGARATVRGRKGKRTRGHCGDICATDKEGEPLVKLITFELKRGYSRFTAADLLDKPKHRCQQPFENWIEQARESSKHAKTRYWAIIQKRDQREALIWMPEGLFKRLMDEYTGQFIPLMLIETKQYQICGTTLDCFLSEVDPWDLQHIWATP
jgi:hypothetical protein